MADESDGIGEAFDAQMRVGLTVASQFGERVSRLREQWARVREARALDEARELAARFEAERATARAQLAVVDQPVWWDQATPAGIADVHETATAWRDYDDVAAAAAVTMRQEIQDRYGIDVDAPGADPAAVAAALAEAETERAHAVAERHRAGEELTASQALLAIADAHDREAQKWAAFDWNGDVDSVDKEEYDEFAKRDDELHGRYAEASSFEYDSSERRQAFAASLEGKAESKAIEARVLADGDQAKHPREAVLAGGTTTPVKKATKATGRQRDRGALAQ